MSPILIVIDGYNLLHAAGWGRVTYGPGDLQRSRERLLNALQRGLKADEQARTLVVFDARRPPPALSRDQQHGAIRIRYASPEGEADPVIEDIIADHSAPKRLTVVSSDHRIQRAAKQRRATALDSDLFLAQLTRRVAVREQRSTESERPTGTLSAAEVEGWLREFQLQPGDLIQQTQLAAPAHAAAPIPGAPIPTAPAPRPKTESPAEATPDTAAATPAAPARVPTKPAGRPRRQHRSDVPSQKRARGHRELLPDLTPEWIAELQAWADQLQLPKLK